ncbi:MAG TPA: hypothetical protein VHL51_07525 [Gaiellales bacterium]|nr:hypothetical protein [Gaiellales bacterium]
MPWPAAHLARRWAVAAATLGGAVAVLLVVSSSRPPSVGVSETHPPPVRSASLLRRAGGVLWWVTGDCRLYRDAMAGQTLDRAPGRFCRAWPSPDGAVVLAAPGEGRTMPPPGRLEALDGRSLHVAAVTGLPADLVAGPVAWSPDSLLAAGCLTGPEGPHIALMAAPWSRANPVAGRCSPAFTQVVTMLTTDGTRVFENGFDLHLSGRLARAVDAAPGGYRVTAITALPYGLAVAVHAGRTGVAASPGRSAIVIVDRRHGTTQEVATPGGASELGAPSGGTAIWYRDAGRGRCLLLPLLRPPPPGLPRVASAFAFSPDGRYAAAAVAGRVVVVDIRSGARGMIPAAGARSLVWTR